MVAAGNVSSEEEATAIVEMALANLKVYFDPNWTIQSNSKRTRHNRSTELLLVNQ